MKQSVASFLLGGILGTALGVAIGFFIFPYVFPPPEAVETLSGEESSTLVAKGQFIHANPSDPIHYGSGKVAVYEHTVFLEADFQVGAGPDFHVYLVAAENIREAADVEAAQFVNLGKLRAFKGSQKYAIPEDVNPADYPSVVIWCLQFSVLISPADLEFEG
jgi:hypothetical protein